MHDGLWIPLVDEPIGDVVARVQREHPDLAVLAASPRRQLAFRTFAALEVGIVLGELLADDPERGNGDGNGAWVARLLRRPEVRERVAAVVQGVGRRVADDPELASGAEWPDEEARRRFRAFALESLGADDRAPKRRPPG